MDGAAEVTAQQNAQNDSETYKKIIERSSEAAAVEKERLEKQIAQNQLELSKLEQLLASTKKELSILQSSHSELQKNYQTAVEQVIFKYIYKTFLF